MSDEQARSSSLRERWTADLDALPAAHVTDLGELRIDRLGVVAHGVVTNDAGEPVPAARVQLARERVVDADPAVTEFRAEAFCTAVRRRRSSNGLTRKSKAPPRIASTALLMEPLAVTTMTLPPGSAALISLRRSRPSPSGSIRSSSTSRPAAP